MKPVALIAALAVAGLGWLVWPDPTPKVADTAPAGAIAEMLAVTMPALTTEERRGQAAFASNCAACHGPNAGGIDGAGPPLIHKIYEPGHHGDQAIALAALRGVRSHHWSFGDMPPVEGITGDEIVRIVAFLRRVQRENGIL